MKNKLIKILFPLLALPAFASLSFYDSSNVALGVSNSFKCSTGLTCTRGVDGKMTVVSSPTLTGTSLSLSTTLAVTGATTLSSTLAVTGASTLNGNVTGDGGDTLSGFLNKLVAATATTITAAQCGSTFYNSGAVAINLPEASAVLGCRLTFVTMNASNFDINPDDADQILIQTNAAGDSTRNATLGNSITLQAMSASQWAPISVQGTWSDIN